jgi:hypothetical protein
METEQTLVRIAQNQATFREANEQIELSAERMKLYTGDVPFICECPREDCTELIRMTLDEYESIREDPTWFATAPGHQDVAVETGAGRVVRDHGDYLVVEKVGLAGQIAKDRVRELYGDRETEPPD